MKCYKNMTPRLTEGALCGKILSTAVGIDAFSLQIYFIMEENMKKLFSVLLVIAMLACMLPVFAVSAANAAVPVAKIDGQTMTGATASGGKAWENTANGLKNTENNSIFVFDQEFKAGTVELTMTKGGDTGIVFGLNGDSMDFWEDKVQYYFLFVNNGTKEIILAKTGEGLGWVWMKSMDCPDYDSKDTIDLKLVYSGKGHIEMWANGKLAYDYCDAHPLTGTRVGIRVGNASVNFTNINITTAAPSDEGIKGGIALPFAKNGDKTLTGYFSGGPWRNDGSKINVTDTSLVQDTWATTFVIDNDTLPLTDGSLTASVRAGNTNIGENWLTGIFFGIEATKNVTLWKRSLYSPKAYVLFVDQNKTLILSKTGIYNEDDRLEDLAKSTAAVENYEINKDFVEIKAEFKTNADGSLTIKGYANGKLMLEYTDTEPLTGTRYGVGARCGGSEFRSLVPVDNVCYHTETKVVGAKEATETEKGYTGDTVCKNCGETVKTGKDIPVKKPAQTGDMTALAVSMATLAIIGTAVIVSKKRNYN